VATARPQGIRRRAAGERRPLPTRDQRLHVQPGGRRRAPDASFRALARRGERTFEDGLLLSSATWYRTSSIPIASSFRCRRARGRDARPASSTIACSCTSRARG
jgi:hypothetical protein